MFSSYAYILILVSIASFAQAEVSPADVKSKLESANKIAQETIDKLISRWEINQFPNFLKTASMTHTSVYCHHKFCKN